MLKSLNIFLFALLMYIAWLQVNDPDPLFWVSLYLLAALAPLMQLINKPIKGRCFLLGLATGFCVAGIAMVFSGATNYLDHIAQESLINDMSPDKPYIEETRELIGTIIALLIVGYYSWLEFKKNC